MDRLGTEDRHSELHHWKIKRLFWWGDLQETQPLIKIVQFVDSYVLMKQLKFESPTENNDRKKGLDIHNLVVTTLVDPQMCLVAKVDRSTSSFELKPIYRN